MDRDNGSFGTFNVSMDRDDGSFGTFNVSMDRDNGIVLVHLTVLSKTNAVEKLVFWWLLYSIGCASVAEGLP